MIWTDLLRTGNIVFVFLVLILLYVTDLDKKILDWLLKS